MWDIQLLEYFAKLVQVLLYEMKGDCQYLMGTFLFVE